MKKLINTLTKRNETISFVESMTGGNLVGKLVKYKDASLILKESYVLYDSYLKSKRLNFDYNLILKYGVVSKEIAKEMVLKLSDLTKANLTVSITGYASGKNPNQVYIGIKYNDYLKVFHQVFDDKNTRIKNINETVKKTYELINKIIN
ncbi:MAG: CinA family protein [Acholeplasmataceae bacterium]